MSFPFIAKGDVAESAPNLSSVPARGTEEGLRRKESEGAVANAEETYRLPEESNSSHEDGSRKAFLAFNTSRLNTGSPTVRMGEGVVADDRQVATPRLSDRTDLDMVYQRRLRQEERTAIRKHRLRAISDYNSFIVKQRGFQIRACHLLLLESQMFQATQMRRGNESEVRSEKPSLTGTLPMPIGVPSAPLSGGRQRESSHARRTKRTDGLVRCQQGFPHVGTTQSTTIFLFCCSTLSGTTAQQFDSSSRNFTFFFETFPESLSFAFRSHPRTVLRG